MTIKLSDFKNIPFYKDKPIEEATVHTPQTTTELVSNTDQDSFYFRMLEELGTFLNERQLEAVRSTEGTVITLAGAGSGKTSVLTARVGYLIKVKKVNPKNILVLTFTVKAANEMKERIANLPGITKQESYAIVSGTFHSIFLKLLRSRGFNQNILSNEKHKQIIIKKILKEMRLKGEYDPETVLARISLEKNRLKRPDDVETTSSIEKEFKKIYAKYERVKHSSNYIDFDDILLETYTLLKNDATLRGQIQKRFQYIEIDEFQDTNLAQYQIIQLIAFPQNNLFVAGDDDQSIYGWRGASNDIILSLPLHYENTKVIVLETNYRSNPHIVGLGSQVIEQNKKRYKKEIKTYHQLGFEPQFVQPKSTQEEANLIIQSIEEDVRSGKRTYSDIAILFRTHSVSRALFDQFILHDIPFIKYGASQPFYEHTIVRPVLDYLRLIIDPHHVKAFEGVCPTLYLNREQTMSFIHNHMTRYNDKSVPSFLHLLLLNDQLKPFQVKHINEKIDLLTSIRALEPQKAIKEIINGKGKYADYLKDNNRQTFTLHKEIVDEMLEELIDSAKRFQTIQSYLEFVSNIIQKHQEMEQLKQSHTIDAVSLMSIHNAKGLEYPRVYLVGASETILPHSSALKEAEDRISVKKGKEKIEEAIEEERRLLYVAITRAKEELFISAPQYFRGKKLEPSTFFKSK